MSFISGISVFCFAASYAVALVLELTRMFFRSGVRGALMLGFAGAGLVAHTLFLGYRAATASGAPLSSAFDWYLLGAWALVVVYLYLTWYHPKTSIGLFLLPLVLALLGLSQFADQQPFPQSRAGQVWGMIHGIFLLLGSGDGVDRIRRGGDVFDPSLSAEAQAAGFTRSALAEFGMAGAREQPRDFDFGADGWRRFRQRNCAQHGAAPAPHRRIALDRSDYLAHRADVRLAAGGGIVQRLYRPARSGRKVAYLTVASFAFLAVSLGLGVLLPSEHGAAAKEKQKAEGRRQNEERTMPLEV